MCARYRQALLFLLVFALTRTPSASAATACVWKVTNAPAPFYLVGTIHALNGNDYPLPAAYDRALRDSKQLFFEVDPDPRGNYGKQFTDAAIYPHGDMIQKHVHPQTWAYLEKAFRASNYLGQRFHMGETFVSDMHDLRPWAIAFFIWQIHGYNDAFSEHGVDNHLAFQARRLGKRTGGLETGTQHIDVLRGMSDMDAELLLLDTMVQGDKRKDTFNATRAAWKKGDIGPIAAELERSRKLNMGGELRLLDYRNLRWIGRIDSLIKSGIPTAIVVGTAHFVGPNNIRELLEKRGYKIEQL